MVLADGSDLTPDRLREWAGDRIARFKVPRHVSVVDALPRNATGKVLKRELRRAETGADSSITR